MPTYGNAHDYKSITIYKNRYYMYGDMVLEKMWRDSNRQNYRFRVLNNIEKDVTNMWIDLGDYHVVHNVKELGRKKDYSLETLKTLYGKVFN